MRHARSVSLVQCPVLVVRTEHGWLAEGGVFLRCDMAGYYGSKNTTREAPAIGRRAAEWSDGDGGRTGN